MPTYEQVISGGTGLAGDADGRNVYKIRFDVNDCSDIPQLQAWDDYNMNSVAIESLAGTAGNGNESLVAAAHTTNHNTGDGGGPAWVPGAGVAGQGDTQQPAGASGFYRANRLRGGEQYLGLGDPGDGAPTAAEERFFQLAFGVADDSTPGTAGHLPVMAVKVFYAGAAPTPLWFYNRGEDDKAPTAVNADWVQMTSAAKGASMAMGVKNTIHATGPGTSTTALDPVVKPGGGEKWAEEQWVLTAL